MQRVSPPHCIRPSASASWSTTTTRREGATGEWSCVVCANGTYAQSLPEEIRSPAMRWLKVHAEYDDTHPWEALDIVATLLGHAPSAQDVTEVRRAIQSSYTYMKMALDGALAAATHGSFDETASNSATLSLDRLHAA